jgi:ELWxxDGT repeat protein
MSGTGRSKAVFTLLVLFGLAAMAGAQPAFLVKDLNTTRPGDSDPVSGFATLGSVVLFPMTDGIHGSELWRTDGTAAGTRMVADICPGACSSAPAQISAVGGLVFFVADDGLHGPELWKSDGTPAGTLMVKDILPEGYYSYIGHFEDFDGLLLFSVSSELWRSDGTAEGTFRLMNFGTNQSDLSLPRQAVHLGGKAFFFAQDSVHGTEPWTTDGTVAGTTLLKDVNPGPGSSSPGNLQMTVAGGKVLFQAYDESHGYELWASDGTDAGTVLVKDVYPGPANSGLQGLISLNGQAFFFASSGSEQGLWKSDGTAGGTLPVKTLPALPGYPASLSRIGGRFFFFLSGCDLWTTDGTEAGTVLVEKAAGSICEFLPSSSTETVLFFASDANYTRPFELWKSDGTVAGTSFVTDLDPGTASSGGPQCGTPAGCWYFLDLPLGSYGLRLWQTDGTAGGTRLLRIDHQASGIALSPFGTVQGGPRAFFDMDGTLLFPGDDGLTGSEPWRTDGTAAGTSLIKDLDAGIYSSFPGEFTKSGGTVFFRSDLGTARQKLWKTDGTLAGTQLLHADEQFYNFGLYSPLDLTAFGGNLLFLGSRYNNTPTELMRSDGTAAGTQPVGSTFFTGRSLVSLGTRVLFQDYELDGLWVSDGTEPGTVFLGQVLPTHSYLKDSSAVRDGVLYFAGTSPEAGEELWRSDGTTAGTYLLAETVPGTDSKRLGPFAVAGPAVFFAAGGNELWKSDAGGTSLVRALPGTDTAGIRSLTAVGNRVYFSYDDGENGRELWMSDGTEAGTRLVEDIRPGPGSSFPKELHAEANLLLFSASDGVHGHEPWRSDGTALGTRMLQDIAPGELPSSPTEFTASASRIYFAANDGTTGFELWAIQRAAISGTFADVPADFWAWRFVEALVANGITGGCSPDGFCPAQPVTRAEAAVFLVRAAHGPAFVPPPASGNLFQDVPAGYWAARWIEQLAADGATSGCGNGDFCPGAPLTRAEMAVLMLRARHGSGFVPAPATGTVFSDVPQGYWAAPWIERLAADGIVAGCGGGRYCPAAATTRAEMAVLLVSLFGLPLP